MDESSILIRRLSLSSAESTQTREAFFSASKLFISFLFFSIFSSPSDRNWFDFIQVNYARVWGG